VDLFRFHVRGCSLSMSVVISGIGFCVVFFQMVSHILLATIKGPLKEGHTHTLFPMLLVLQDPSIAIPHILYTILLVEPQMEGPS